MGYYYSDPERENEVTALPDVEVFAAPVIECKECGTETMQAADWSDPIAADCPSCLATIHRGLTRDGWFYAFGFPGCLWDSDPVGPFDSEEEALAEAQQQD